MSVILKCNHKEQAKRLKVKYQFYVNKILFPLRNDNNLQIMNRKKVLDIV